MNASERITTQRLILRRPQLRDAGAIFARYASDCEVTRYLGWPRHESIAQTEDFLRFSDSEWDRWPAGPFLIESRADGRLLGASGLAFETRYRAATGYVLAQDAWGFGYATEALQSMLDLALDLHMIRLYALCHTEHQASARVLEKCGFEREAILRRHTVFPNLDPGEPCDVVCYTRIFARLGANS